MVRTLSLSLNAHYNKNFTISLPKVITQNNVDKYRCSLLMKFMTNNCAQQLHYYSPLIEPSLISSQYDSYYILQSYGLINLKNCHDMKDNAINCTFMLSNNKLSIQCSFTWHINTNEHAYITDILKLQPNININIRNLENYYNYYHASDINVSTVSDYLSPSSSINNPIARHALHKKYSTTLRINLSC
ncbi:hypothetical protein HL033_00395 [Neoehrlichia mikurensis]|uniref:Uncharacterized protein n=1 Tax=Neoehrlichia mikurensis TaxID=89586 RepID=A0A9Q9BSL6_9RICK|nr:hypothetical protein [Neoehrlichia mikurensis]QXK92036.1 hypothetical protein IAH97_00395 [Neoehrlichia mikurensis]QXK92494.1 hypothetical protein HUN61_00395 [Neoehrlichia mikurensis]QXK93729.1 hypothetical protein HL033_00395 [Neoehrlichia mikurensis]UTO55297.1 hypothetical protein LUA82_03885 [Neoehrlichia mikurensis]UTO56217.1 hypothetical protein LUA81_03850 [Neoehrlichia mikurensis]